MTSPIDNNRRRPIRSNSSPIERPVAKPELKRANSAPAKSQPQQVRDSMETARRPATANTASAPTKASVFGKLKDMAKSWHRGAVATATQDAVASGVGKLGILKRAGGMAGGVFGVYSGMKKILDNEDGYKRAEGALTIGKGVLGTFKGSLATAAAIESRAAFKGLEKAAAAAIGDGGKLSKAIAKSAAEAVHLGKDLTKLDVLGQAARSSGFLGKLGTMAKSGAAGLLDKLPGGVGAALAGKINAKIIKTGGLALGGDAKGVATALNTAETATKAAEAAAKGAGTAAKAAGRFVPGLNVGIAALDVGLAIKTISDPKATVAAKVTSGITALGSVAAATNIPIVSQVGAAVSMASTVVGAAIENSDAIKDGAKKVGSAIADGAKKIFSGW